MESSALDREPSEAPRSGTPHSEAQGSGAHAAPAPADGESTPVVIGDLTFVPFISVVEIGAAVDRIAAGIETRYAGADPLVVCVLNGAALFHADLVRRIRLPLEVDYLRVASYHGGLSSSGTINFTAPPGTLATGRNVILVEDIVDTGRTARSMRAWYAREGAASVAVATLLYKHEADEVGERPEFVGIDIPLRFVIGYGLDYRQMGRNLPAIHMLHES